MPRRLMCDELLGEWTGKRNGNAGASADGEREAGQADRMNGDGPMARAAEADDEMGTRLSRVPLCRHRVHAAGRAWLIEAVADQDALLAAADQFDAFPYGLLLWDSALVLADGLASLGPLDGRRVLELGAGVGLAGLAARWLGAEVVQTDHAAEALELARRNAILNGIDGIRPQLADWASWSTGQGRHDLILGSDILYDGSAHGLIANVLEVSLEADGVALLTDPGRTATPMFVADMQAAGWVVSQGVRQIGAIHPVRPGETIDVALIEVRRPEHSRS